MQSGELVKTLDDTIEVYPFDHCLQVARFILTMQEVEFKNELKAQMKEIRACIKDLASYSSNGGALLKSEPHQIIELGHIPADKMLHSIKQDLLQSGISLSMSREVIRNKVHALVSANSEKLFSIAPMAVCTIPTIHQLGWSCAPIIGILLVIAGLLIFKFRTRTRASAAIEMRDQHVDLKVEREPEEIKEGPSPLRSNLQSQSQTGQTLGKEQLNPYGADLANKEKEHADAAPSHFGLPF